MLFMVVPLLGVDFSPRLDLNIISSFPSRAAVESMSRERWIKTKSRYYSYSAKPDWVEQKTQKKNALPGDFLFFGRQTGCDGSELWIITVVLRSSDIAARHLLYTKKRGYVITFFAIFMEKRQKYSDFVEANHIRTPEPGSPCDREPAIHGKRSQCSFTSGFALAGRIACTLAIFNKKRASERFF